MSKSDRPQQNMDTSIHTPSEEAYRTLMQNEWADLHHSRVQEWSALGVVTGAHLALTQIPKILGDIALPMAPSVIMAIACLFGLVFAIVGGLVTCRHRRLMYIKLNWIYEAEDKLGLIKNQLNPSGVVPEIAQMRPAKQWKGLMWPRLLSTSGLILLFYFLFCLIDIACIILCMSSS